MGKRADEHVSGSGSGSPKSMAGSSAASVYEEELSGSLAQVQDSALGSRWLRGPSRLLRAVPGLLA